MEDDEPDYDPLKESLTFFEGLFNPFERLFSLFGVNFSFYWCVVRDAKVNCKKKWSREILRAKRERKEGLPSKPKRLNNTLLSHCKKNKLAYVRSVDHALSTFEIRVPSCRISENRKANQRV